MAITHCKDPHAGGYDPNGSKGDWAQHVAEGHEVTYVGAVLLTGEHNHYDDSDGYALVWDEEAQQVREVGTWTTRGWTYHDGAEVDATRANIEKAVAWTAARYLERWEEEHAKDVRKGMTARVTVKGETLEGVIGWVGESKPFTAWEQKYGTREARYGVRVEGREKMIFRNADSPSLEVDVPAWTAEERQEQQARAEYRARGDFREALRLADEREPLPAAPAPGTVVDSQEGDDAGMRLYAVGESFCDEKWARGVAVAVVDESAEEYRVMGSRADLSLMPDRVASVFQALGHVARWVENDGARILHDGAGTVRIEREDGARLYLVPVRAGGEAEDGPQGAQEVPEALRGTEGDPEWVARRDAALEALQGLMDGGAARYRRTVLVEGSDARGASDTMATETARAYLAEEIADGGEVGRRGMAGGVLLVRANGARLELSPVRGGAETAREGGERHEMVSGLPMGGMACACGLDDVDALLEHWVSTGVIPVVPVVEMSGVWRITGRGAEVYAEGATAREAWADAARRGFERDYFHAITHLTMVELEALTAPQERTA